MEPKYCAECGTQLSKNESRCKRCGWVLKQEDTSTVFRANPTSTLPSSVSSGTKPKRKPVTESPATSSLSELDEYALKGSPFEPVGLAGWMGILLLMLIPGINLLLLVIWSCGGCKKYTQRNFARAILVFIFFALVLFIIGWLFLGNFWQRYLDLLYYYW